jgi:hypothetical protein
MNPIVCLARILLVFLFKSFISIDAFGVCALAMNSHLAMLYLELSSIFLTSGPHCSGPYNTYFQGPIRPSRMCFNNCHFMFLFFQIFETGYIRCMGDSL